MSCCLCFLLCILQFDEFDDHCTAADGEVTDLISLPIVLIFSTFGQYCVKNVTTSFVSVFTCTSFLF